SVRLVMGARIGGGLRHSRYGNGRAEGGLSRADRSRLRIGEGHARHGVVVGLARFAEDVRRDNPSLIFPDMGQLPDAVDIADRPQALASAQARVDRDAARIGFDSGGLRAGAIAAGAPAGGAEQPVAAELPPVVEFQGVALALAP